MRCREAKQRLIEIENQADGAPMPIELARHLKECPECARLAIANRIVSQGFRDLRENPAIETTPLAAVKVRVSARAIRHRQKEPTFMFAVWRNLTSHPRMSLGFASGLVALVLMATIPISCSRTVGYSVEGTDADTAAEFDKQHTMSLTFESLNDGTVTDLEMKAFKIQEAMKALGHENVWVSLDEETGHQTLHIEGLETHEQAREAALVLERIAGFEGDIAIAEQKGRVRSSLLGHLTHNIFELNVDTNGKSDEQIEEELRASLLAQGFDFDVTYKSTEDGKQMIFIGDSSLCNDGSVHFDGGTVVDWMNDNGNGEVHRIQLDGDAGLTSEEMKSAVMNQLRKQGGDSVTFEIKLTDSSCCDPK